MKLLTFGLFIAAITLQISAIEIVEEREDGKEDLESRIDMELEEERVKALDVESRELDAKQCPCKKYKVEASGWQYYDNREKKVFGGEFVKKYSNNGNFGRQYDVIWQQDGTNNVIAGLSGAWEMGKWSGQRLSETFVRVNTGRSADNICPDASALVDKWKYRSNGKRGRFSKADNKPGRARSKCIRWHERCWGSRCYKVYCIQRESVPPHPPRVIKVTCTQTEDQKERRTQISNLSQRPRPSNQSSKKANAFGKRPTQSKNKRRNNFGRFQNARHHFG